MEDAQARVTEIAISLLFVKFNCIVQLKKKKERTKRKEDGTLQRPDTLLKVRHPDPVKTTSFYGGVMGWPRKANSACFGARPCDWGEMTSLAAVRAVTTPGKVRGCEGSSLLGLFQSSLVACPRVSRHREQVPHLCVHPRLLLCICSGCFLMAALVEKLSSNTIQSHKN